MIFTAEDPRACDAQILDKDGNNICKTYMVKWYNTETQIAGVMDVRVDEKGKKHLLPDGLGSWSMSMVHFPGSKLVLDEPLIKE